MQFFLRMSHIFRFVSTDPEAKNSPYGCHCTLTVIQQGNPSEARLFPHLVEDRGAGGAGAMSYADFLIQLHRQVAQSGAHQR